MNEGRRRHEFVLSWGRFDTRSKRALAMAILIQAALLCGKPPFRLLAEGSLWSASALGVLVLRLDFAQQPESWAVRHALGLGIGLATTWLASLATLTLLSARQWRHRATAFAAAGLAAILGWGAATIAYAPSCVLGVGGRTRFDDYVWRVSWGLRDRDQRAGRGGP